MGKTVAIVQSNYIPWKGYFDMVHMVDEFVLYDDVQYTRRDWRNRNRIKTPKGLQWLTIPVDVKGKYLQKIKDTRISDPEWNRRHWQSIVQNYVHAPFFHRYQPEFEALYLDMAETQLSSINYKFIVFICELLEIHTHISWSMDYEMDQEADKTQKLIQLCKQTGATRYLSGPAARDYIDESLFVSAGIGLDWMDYSGYPEYLQLFPPFEHGVSILDLIFNTGPDAVKHLKSFGNSNYGTGE